jgi:DNA-binding LacI/PurR family transcriptional regulator/DNA-binding transcriptional regulator YhcF (GntR family)
MPRPAGLLPRLVGEVRQQILSGFAPGETLPSTRQWARMYRISEASVRRILKELRDDRLITVQARMRCVRAATAAARPKKQTLRVGIISRLVLDEWEKRENYSIFQWLSVCAERRGFEIVRVPHHMPVRVTARQNEIELARVPWNDFDVGLLVGANAPTLSQPILQKRLVLSIDGDATPYGVSSVCHDNRGAGRTLAEYLFELGHRRFAVTDEVNPPGWPNSTEWTTRRLAFETALGRLGGCIRPAWRMETHRYHQRSVKESVPLRREVMMRATATAWAARAANDRPTALYAPDANMLDGIQHFSDFGLKIPRDLSLVTCAWRADHITQLGVKLTHIWLDTEAMAQRALDAAADLLRGSNHVPFEKILSENGVETRLYRLPTRLVPGESTRTI